MAEDEESPRVPKKWDKVASDPKFQRLTPEQQRHVREQYFDRVIAPSLGDKAADGKQMWMDKYTTASRSPAVSAQDKIMQDFHSKANQDMPYEAGGNVTEWATKAGLPTGVAAGAGVAANMGLNALQFMAGGTGSAAVGAKVGTSLQNIGRDLMGSALKISGKNKIQDAATIIDTMLEEGINVTHGGIDKLRGMIGELNNEVRAHISQSSATVPKSVVDQPLTEALDKFRRQATPEADIATIRKAWAEFRRHPLLRGSSDIPVQLAQDIKQGTQRKMAEEYGSLGSAGVEAQKSIARGLKEGIAKAVPEVAPLNAQESRLLAALEPLERRVLVEMRKNPVGLSLLAHNPKAALAFMADRSGLFKSLAARMIYSSGKIAPEVAASGQTSLQEISRDAGP